MDEDCVQLELFSTFTSSSFLRWTISPRRWTPYRALSSIYRRGCILKHHHYLLQFLHSMRLSSSYPLGRRLTVSMKTAHAHYKPYKTILFYEAPAAHVELTPSKFNSGGVESDRDQNHLHFYKACYDRGQMSHESSSSRRAWKLMTILMGIRSQH